MTVFLDDFARCLCVCVICARMVLAIHRHFLAALLCSSLTSCHDALHT